MYYVLLIHADEAEVANAEPGEIESLVEAVDRFDQELTLAGQNLGSIRLRTSSEATTLSVREGKRRVTDGPFAETKEQLGGLYHRGGGNGQCYRHRRTASDL